MYDLNSNIDCLFYCIEKICYNLESDYKMVLLAGWKFGYEDGKSIGESLENGNKDNIWRVKELLHKYHKIKMEINQYINVNEVDDYIYCGIPIVLRCDTYWCDWLPYYKKQHGKHSILLMVKDKEDYYFYDQFSDGKRKINKEFITEHCFEMLHFIKELESPILDKCLYDEELKKSAQLYEANQGCEMHRRFIYELVHFFSIVKEIGEEDILQSLFIKNLSFLAEDRKSLIMGIQYIESIVGKSYILITEKLFELVNAYTELKIYVIKSYYLNKFERSNEFIHLCRRIQEVEQLIQNSLNTYNFVEF